VAAETLEFPDALRVVRERGRAMQGAVPVGIGSMAAVIGLGREALAEICAEAAGDQVVSLANLNGADQIVIAGHREAVERAGALARERGAKRAIPLPVSAPFHCALMQPAAEKLRAALEPLAVRTPKFPVINNVEARAYSDAAEIKEMLVRQVTMPVRWEESVQTLARLGCRLAVEVGPGRVLAALVRRIAPEISCVAGEDREAVRSLESAA